MNGILHGTRCAYGLPLTALSVVGDSSTGAFPRGSMPAAGSERIDGPTLAAELLAHEGGAGGEGVELAHRHLAG